jgi:hypothetical protein
MKQAARGWRRRQTNIVSIDRLRVATEVLLLLAAAGCATETARPYQIPKGLEEHFRDEMQQS